MKTKVIVSICIVLTTNACEELEKDYARELLQINQTFKKREEEIGQQLRFDACLLNALSKVGSMYTDRIWKCMCGNQQSCFLYAIHMSRENQVQKEQEEKSAHMHYALKLIECNGPMIEVCEAIRKAMHGSAEPKNCVNGSDVAGRLQYVMTLKKMIERNS